jgi:branched-chain amino acid transport system ATP-binding protein
MEKIRAMSDALFSLQEIRHSFRGLHVLKGVQLAVAPGDFVGLIGPNGAGKSTLFNIASGFLTPDHGGVHFDGAQIMNCSVQERSRRGLVRTFQTPKVFGGMSVLENLMVGSHKRSRSGIVGNLFRSSRSRREFNDAQSAAYAVLDRFNLKHVAESAAANLPAGLQRMLELARAYIAKPQLLMLDEPSSGLNGDEIRQLKRVLNEMNGEGIAILLVSHDMDLVEAASTVHVLCFGEIIASGAMAEVRQDARVREAYLGT